MLFIGYFYSVYSHRAAAALRLTATHSEFSNNTNRREVGRTCIVVTYILCTAVNRNNNQKHNQFSLVGLVLVFRTRLIACIQYSKGGKNKYSLFT